MSERVRASEREKKKEREREREREKLNDDDDNGSDNDDEVKKFTASRNGIQLRHHQPRGLRRAHEIDLPP